MIPLNRIVLLGIQSSEFMVTLGCQWIIYRLTYGSLQPILRKPANPRVHRYLLDVLSLSRLNDIGRESDVVAEVDGFMGETLTVCSRVHGTATVLYLLQPGFITVFWMAGFFREVPEIGISAFS